MKKLDQQAYRAAWAEYPYKKSPLPASRFPESHFLWGYGLQLPRLKIELGSSNKPNLRIIPVRCGMSDII